MGKNEAREIGQRFRQARKALGMSQTALADRVGIHQSAVSRLEKGERGIETAQLLALFQELARAGANVDGFVLLGNGEPISTGNNVADELVRLASRLKGQH